MIDLYGNRAMNYNNYTNPLQKFKVQIQSLKLKKKIIYKIMSTL